MKKLKLRQGVKDVLVGITFIMVIVISFFCLCARVEQIEPNVRTNIENISK